MSSGRRKSNGKSMEAIIALINPKQEGWLMPERK